MPELLRDEREVQPGRVEPRYDRQFGGLVDRGRLVATFAVADDALALGARRHLGEHRAHVLRGGATDREPVRHRGWKSRPEGSFG